MTALYKAPGEAPTARSISSDRRSGLSQLLGGEIEVTRFTTDVSLITRKRSEALPFNFDFCGLQVHGPALFVATAGRKFTDMPPAIYGFLRGILDPEEKE